MCMPHWSHTNVANPVHAISSVFLATYLTVEPNGERPRMRSKEGRGGGERGEEGRGGGGERGKMCTGVKNLNYCTHTTYAYSTHISDIVLMME